MTAPALRSRWPLALVVIAGAAAWFVLRVPAGPSRAAEEPPQPLRDRRASTLTVMAHVEQSRTELPLLGPGPEAVPSGFAHPHPITERHREIQRENGLIMLLNDAMAARKGARMRELVREYRERLPRGSEQLREGYEIIAECLENPSQESRAAGERYYAEHRSSTLRRFVRRYCVEGARASHGEK